MATTATTIKNPVNGKAVFRMTANATIVANTDVQAVGETVTGMGITRVLWSTANNITIARGSNTILELSQSGDWDLQGKGITDYDTASANVVVTFNGLGSLYLEVNKILG